MQKMEDGKPVVSPRNKQRLGQGCMKHVACIGMAGQQKSTFTKKSYTESLV